MRLHDGPANRETQARPAACSISPGVHAVEAVEDALLVSEWNAGSRILDPKLHPGAFEPGADFYRAPAGRVRNCVIDQVDQKLHDQVTINLGPGGRRCIHQHDVFTSGDWRVLLDSHADQLGE